MEENGRKGLGDSSTDNLFKEFYSKGEQRNGLLAEGRSRLKRRIFKIEKVLGGLRRKEAAPRESGRAGGPGKWVGLPGTCRAPLEICTRELKVGSIGKSCFSPTSLAARYRPRLGRELDLTSVGALQNECDKEKWVRELRVYIIG